jgi:uncharacterized protein (DUF2062 family)
MPRRLLRKLTARLQPAVDRMTANPTVRHYLPALADPDLWHLNRRSTARAVAIGLFCGLIPGPLQVPGAIALLLVIRANFPLAVITTFYTNPLTIVPLYVLAYEYGHLFLADGGGPAPAFVTPAAGGATAYFSALLAWMVSLGKPLALGLFLLAGTLAACGWVAVRLAWRAHAIWAWRRRARLRQSAA